MNDYIGRQIGHYRILSPLGTGSFATVYLAEHLYIERLAAIKILHIAMGTENHQDFQKEARINARLEHSHIIRLLDFGFYEQMPYLVMEYAPNGTLRKLHPKGTRVPPEQMIVYVKQIAEALDYAHQQNVIHRDVKPENILLNSKNEIVLSDFGIAVVEQSRSSFSGRGVAGTPQYMAPEQFKGAAFPASDQYALGIMVYEWLCGEPPFSGNMFALSYQHMQQAPLSLCKRRPDISPAVDDAVSGALAKNPGQRFACVQDFVVALEEAFFATQPLLLSRPLEHEMEEEITLSLVAMPLVPNRAVQVEEHVEDVTQPELKKIQLVQGQPEPGQANAPRPTSPHHRPFVMCIAAPPDQGYLRRLEIHIQPLVQAGHLTVWSEQHILPGMPREQELGRNLQNADILVLLLSADFFVSDECMALMQRALQRYQQDKVFLIPFLIRPAAWRETPLAAFSCIPSNLVPVSEWPDQEAAIEECVRAVLRVLRRPDQPANISSLETPLPLPPVPVSQNQTRLRLMRRVRSFWIAGVLEQSLEGAAFMELDFQERPDAVVNPWKRVVQTSTMSPRPAQRKSILQIYDDADGELLILGAPGAGKTTLLLTLARDLLVLAEQNERFPAPVIFNLSTWSNNQPLVEWLVDELNSKYQVPRKLGQQLVKGDLILPLLDGLDEVATRERTACIEAINRYRREHGASPLVVCSRSIDYLAQEARVLLGGAVMIQPLSMLQANEYLVKAGEPLKALRVALQKDASLRELMRTPLLLRMLTLTYRNMPVPAALHRASAGKQIQLVLEHYVERMLARGSDKAGYTAQSTKHWLAWLARQMRQRNQKIFYIERLQPDWSEGRQTQQRYPRVMVGLIFGLLGLFGLGPLWGWFAISSAYVKELFTNMSPVLMLSLALLFTLGDGLLLGLVNGALYKRHAEKLSTTPARQRWKRRRQRIVRAIVNALLIGLLPGVLYGLIEGYVSGNIFVELVVTSPPMGMAGGLGLFLIDGLLGIETTEIQPAEIVAWSWVNMWRNLIKFLLVGLLSALILGLFIALLIEVFSVNFTLASFWHITLNYLLGGLVLGGVVALFFAPLGALVGALTGGLSSNVLDQRNFAMPNQGIHHSARHSLLIGLVSLFFIVGVPMLITILLKMSWFLSFVLLFGPLITLVIALRAGGIACIQHFVLRWLLWRDGAMPWNYPRFLNYAAEHTLLQKVGGGYMFVHRFLLEYFASLEASPPR
jgi:serine/threonine protein kinase/DNA polymerase III delta prime subunit/MFS family permease